MTGEGTEVVVRSGWPPGEPRCLMLLHPYLWIQFVIGVVVLIVSGFAWVSLWFQPSTVGPRSLPIVIAVFAWSLFQAVVPIIADFAIAYRKPHGWAIAFALLFCRSAIYTSLLAMLIATQLVRDWGYLPSMVTLLVPLTLMLALTVAHFRSREWYGVERRDGWRTVRAKAGWTLAWAFLLEALPVCFYFLMQSLS